ncbi:MAG: patatin-like phospholipase family protein [Caldilineaceae bacterium]|nr:patatin-like phospholipase family protein [Caldilineaceae bacterium]HRJ43648.1 patatin-like phospholipase family protein [Caldilineaceae bacterium]
MEQYERERMLPIVWEGKPPRQRVGLALGGGAARGFAHIGVLEVLEEAHIPIDCIAGTSAGAIAGGLYAAGFTTAEMRKEAQKLNWLEIASFGIPKMGLLNFDKAAQWIEELLVDRPSTFEQLSIPFAAVAADIVRGELVAINTGKLSAALRASSSVPGIFTPTRMGDRMLVDGGTLNNLPVSVARRLGADYVIAVDLLPPGTVGGKEPANVMELTVTALYMLMRSTHNEGAEADRVIIPAIGHLSLIDLGHKDELIQAGRDAAELIVPKIKRDLGLG